MLTFKEAQWPHCKSSVLFGCFVHLYLPKTWLEVKAGECTGPLQALQGLLDARKRVTVLFGPHIQFPEIYTEAEASILLPDEYDSITPGATTRSNGPCLQHIIHMCHLFQQWWWDMPEPFLKRFIIVVTLILFLTWLVHPSSLSLRENTSWYCLNSAQARSIFSADHLSRLKRSRLVISFSWHSSTLRVDLGFSDSFKVFNVPGFNWGQGSSLLACTWATFWPFLRWIGNPVMFHSTTGTVLLPHLRTV